MSEELLKYRRGPAKDVIDRQCQNWYRCTKCIKIDSFGTCLPESKNYHVTLNFLSGRYECPFDADSCALKTCMCDVELANQIAQNAGEIKAYLLNSNGWDPSFQCKPSKRVEPEFEVGPIRTMSLEKNDDEPDSCCGDYPQRYPFKSLERGCCGKKTFRKDRFQCCYGEVVQHGECSKPLICNCQNGGKCIEKGLKVFCSCINGFHGDNCEWGACQPDPCWNGECEDKITKTGIAGAFKCHCHEGWTGQLCDIPFKGEFNFFNFARRLDAPRPDVGDFRGENETDVEILEDNDVEIVFNDRKFFTGKSEELKTKTTELNRQNWNSSGKIPLKFLSGKFDFVVFFSSHPLSGAFSYEARLRKQPILHFQLSKDDGSRVQNSNFYGEKMFYVNPKQARRFVPLVTEGLCREEFQQTSACAAVEKVTFLKRVEKIGISKEKKILNEKSISNFISAAWETLDQPKLDVISFGNAQKGLSAKVNFQDDRFDTSQQIETKITEEMKWFGGKATFGAILERISIQEKIILVSNGFFGDLSEIKARPNLVTIGFDPMNAILRSSLEDLAQGDARRVFFARNKEDLEGISADIPSALCAAGENFEVPDFSIPEKTLFEFASGYRARLNSFPSNMPGFADWKAGKQPFLNYNREYTDF
ncbi:Oidioi.mRNA.OKI2018_I69.chr2.g5432.t1.cds [Oikopleura dioica]|uniref:Oidioi.mRNA.OKI2018_I69.chr2.g5432.t1.cds n=1 Tax=Oikopleura dioica TaxID=34765 RepID=A0ABN7T0E7_OIKDI|nr:Oidioi.mRNA.OKI2018_I69.chr2.g5432.t1.cds [Oikopleura dioica]